MKKITFLFLLLVVSFGYSQVVLEDFDGPAPTIALSNASAGTSATIVTDPAPGAANANVLEFITDAAGVPWQQAELTLQGDYMDLTGTDKTITVDMYSEAPMDLLIRITDGVVSSTDGTPVADSAGDGIHPGGGWQTVTIDFGDGETQDGQAVANGIYGRLFFFNLWDANDSGTGAGAWTCNPPGGVACASVTSYFDEIRAFAADIPETCFDGILNNGEEQIDCGGPNCDACPAAPMEAAPTQPFRAPDNVRSIFCAEYNDIAVDTYDTSWCGATTSTVMIEGRPTQRITGLGCEGIEFVTGRFDATEFPFFHMDIWTDTPTMDKSFNFKISDWQGGGSEVGALEYSTTNASTPVALPNPNPGTWISIDLQLSDFTVINGVDGSDAVQFVITSDLGTVYYDNLYFHNNNLSVDEFSLDNISVYPNPTLNVWNVKTSTQTINSIQVFDILGKQVLTLSPNAQDAVIDASTLNSGLYFAKVNSDAGTQTLKLVRE